MTAGLQRWLLDHLPAGIVARPSEWFLAILCSLSGLTITTGLSNPGSVEALLWRPVYHAWGATLLVGGGALMCGLTSIRWVPDTERYLVTRVPCYRLGLKLLGLASLAYVVAILFAAGLNSAVAAAVTLAFAAMCGVRLLTIGAKR